MGEQKQPSFNRTQSLSTIPNGTSYQNGDIKTSSPAGSYKVLTGWLNECRSVKTKQNCVSGGDGRSKGYFSNLSGPLHPGTGLYATWQSGVQKETSLEICAEKSQPVHLDFAQCCERGNVASITR